MTNQDEPRSEPGHETPEGYTKEEPGADELGQLGTPGAGMSVAAPHAADVEAVEHGDTPADPLPIVTTDTAASVAHHDATTHMDAHTTLSDDDHGHAEAAIGPVDWAAWSFALIGLASALVVVALFWMAIN